MRSTESPTVAVECRPAIHLPPPFQKNRPDQMRTHPQSGAKTIFPLEIGIARPLLRSSSFLSMFPFGGLAVSFSQIFHCVALSTIRPAP